jgi:hypothetical protein
LTPQSIVAAGVPPLFQKRSQKFPFHSLAAPVASPRALANESASADLGIRFAAKKPCDDLFFQSLRLGRAGRLNHSLFVLWELLATPLKLFFEFMDEFQDAALFAGRQILDFVDNRRRIHSITLPFDFHKGKAARVTRLGACREVLGREKMKEG